jgi:hypothetical protein
MSAHGEAEATPHTCHQTVASGTGLVDTGARVLAGVVGRAVALDEERGQMLGVEHFLLTLAESGNRTLASFASAGSACVTLRPGSRISAGRY